MKMLELIDNFPNMMKDAYATAEKFKVPPIGKINHIVITGMGGSAIGGDLIKAVYGSKLNIPLIIERSHTLPHFVNDKTLLFVVSYSGDTEEALSVLYEGLRRKAKIFAITSGGKLLEITKKKNIPVIWVKPELPPRAALPYLFIPILLVLGRVGLISKVPAEILAAEKFIRRIIKKHISLAKDFAEKIYGKIPVIYGSKGITEVAAYRLKTQFNENAKVFSVFNTFPELTHNELVGLCGDNLVIIIFRDKKEKLKIKKMIEVTKSLIRNKVCAVYEVYAQGRSLLEKLLYLIVFGDYLSVHLAHLRGVDPVPVELIGKLKEALR